MITEDYVSFETAKLLKEKGFKEITQGYITADKEIYMLNFQEGVYELGKNKYPYPTLQMAMKWLREVHNIFICIIPSEVGAGVMDYTYVLYKIDAKNFYFEDLDIQGRANNISEISFKEVCETAILYCLENLI